jgi:hypothetical protein
MDNEWQGLATKAAPRIGQWAIGALNQPSAYSAAADIAGLGGGGQGATQQGVSGLSAGGASSLAAPLIMAYLRYQAGSGVNEPVWKANETKKLGRLLSDMLKGEKIDWNQVENNYGVKPAYLPSSISGFSPDSVEQMVDPRGLTARGLYDQMHQYSSDYYQQGGVGNSGFSGAQIDSMFGPLQGELTKALGVDKLPDWTKFDKGSGFSGSYAQAPEIQQLNAAHPQVQVESAWQALDPETRRQYYSRGGDYTDVEGNDQGAMNAWNNDQIVKQLNDQYQMQLKTAAERAAERSGMV